MGTTAELRRQVESALAGRIPAALSFRPPVAPELLSCGLAEIDAVLGGGLPLGAITELTGAHSSGRTTLALATLAEVTRQGASCAYVDVSDALDPISAASLGVDLRRLLWVRAGGTGIQGADAEGADFTPAFSDPGVSAAMISDGKPTARRQPVRRAGKLHRESPWTQLEHGLRATDLLLGTGGFRAIVLDMGDVPPEQARRVPLATWYRFRLQAEKSRTLLLLLTRAACAGSCAAVSLHCRQGGIDWRQAALHAPRLLAGLGYRVCLQRSRALDLTRKKPAAAAEAAWSSATSWLG
jgi:hypothetical protein